MQTNYLQGRLAVFVYRVTQKLPWLQQQLRVLAAHLRRRQQSQLSDTQLSAQEQRILQQLRASKTTRRT